MASRQTIPPFPETGFVRYDVVVAYTGLSKSTIQRKIKEGQFPKPIYLGGNDTLAAWPAEVFRDWLKAQREAWAALQPDLPGQRVQYL